MKKAKQCYVSPSIEVIRMENEGVIAASGESYTPVSKVNNSTGSWSNSASSSDLEDMINDIFTVQN